MFFLGLLIPLGFAPFHLPGVVILSMALFYIKMSDCEISQAPLLGFIFGLGYFGLGVSWVIVSIHDYGNLNYFFAGLATLAFITYLSCFAALASITFKRLRTSNKLLNRLAFSSIWCLSDYLRSTLFTGFPWLLIGTSQIDTPLKYFFPIVGVYGVSFICLFCSTLVATIFKEKVTKSFLYVIPLVMILLLPNLLKNELWTKAEKKPISVGIIQANLAMRDKWDEQLFWTLLKRYEEGIMSLLGKQELIILPESAIPLPASYLNDYLQSLGEKALNANSSIILGVLQPSDDKESHYFNQIISLGHANGTYIKRHLVPFGEYIPGPFVAINKWLNLPEPNIMPGVNEQEPVIISGHAVASLICYEIAYPALLRSQMPKGEWIISVSDNGWFGRSFASYQQLQMAQMLSLLTARYQLVVNNDGLSSVVNSQGDIVDSLPAFSAGTLKNEFFPVTGVTPWIFWGDWPALLFCVVIFLSVICIRLVKPKS